MTNAKVHWLVAILTIQVLTPLGSSKDDDDEENDPMKVLVDFIKEVVDQLRGDGELGENVKNVLGFLKEAFSGDEYQGTFIPAIVKMVDEVLKNGFFIGPETFLKIMKSVLNESTKEPDKLSNNLRRVWHRSINTVGNTVENIGGVGAAVIRVVKDLYNKQRSIMNPIFAEIPYIGPVLQKVNNVVARVLGAIQMVMKVGVKRAGTAISDYAQRKRKQLKNKVAKEREEEKKKAKEADEEDETEDEETDESKKKKKKGETDDDDANPKKKQKLPPTDKDKQGTPKKDKSPPKKTEK